MTSQFLYNVKEAFAPRLPISISKLTVNVRFSFISFFLIWPLLSTHCRCIGLLLHLMILINTHTHSVGFPWTRDREVAEAWFSFVSLSFLKPVEATFEEAF
jgi:hypothetical protein